MPKSATFADDVMAACAGPTRYIGLDGIPAKLRRDTAAHIQARMRRSHRYTLDHDVGVAATQLSHINPLLLLEMLGRIRMPYDAIWIEVPSLAIASGLQWPPARAAGDTMGFFLKSEGDTCTFQRVVYNVQDGMPQPMIDLHDMCLPYRALAPYEEQERMAACRRLGDIIDLPSGLLLRAVEGIDVLRSFDDEGRPLDEPPDDDHTQRDEARRKLAAYIIPTASRSAILYHRAGIRFEQPTDAHHRCIINEINIYTVTWRFALAMLLLISERKHVTFVPTSATSTCGRGDTTKVRYLDHSRITLRLNVEEMVREVSRNLAQSVPFGRREHRVRGHWAETRKVGVLSCGGVHEYRDETPTRQRCLLCGAARWWRADHKRGDASFGELISETKVIL
ncbi:MAG: hypothetical protein ACRYG8_16690 [Janthinobacterium lividum]